MTGGDHAGDFLKLLRNGHDFGLEDLRYAYQEGEGGIAEALGLAEHFAAGDPIVVILGDNVFQESLAGPINRFRRRPTGAQILVKEVHDPERFGVATLDGDRVTRIIEKPAEPETRFAVTGCYMYDARVFDVVRALEPSGRGELEITDVNNRYVAWDSLRHHVVSGWWADAGTVHSLHRATVLVAADRDNPVLTELAPGVGAKPVPGREPGVGSDGGRRGGLGVGAEPPSA